MTDEKRKRYGRYAALVAMAGSAIVVATDFAMWFIIDGYNPLSQTISELAAGPHHNIQDAGIVAFSIGILALALASRLIGRDNGRAHWLQAALVGLTVTIALIALYNEYGDGDRDGPVIHMWLLGALYLLVAGIIWLTDDLKVQDEARGGRFSTVALIVWLVAAPALLLMPDQIYGGYERLLAFAMVATVAFSARDLYRKCRS